MLRICLVSASDTAKRGGLMPPAQASRRTSPHPWWLQLTGVPEACLVRSTSSSRALHCRRSAMVSCHPAVSSPWAAPSTLSCLGAGVCETVMTLHASAEPPPSSRLRPRPLCGRPCVAGNILLPRERFSFASLYNAVTAWGRWRCFLALGLGEGISRLMALYTPS